MLCPVKVVQNMGIHLVGQSSLREKTKTRPCNIQKKNLGVKMKISTGKMLIFFLFLCKTGEAVLTSTDNLCFG